MADGTSSLTLPCAVCGAKARPWRVIDDHLYTECPACESLALNFVAMEEVDAGQFPRPYDETYWEFELSAARQRSWGPGIARMAETILYTRRPIERFLDLGSGPGFMLDSVAAYLPASAHKFYAVEKFPPAERTQRENYIVADLADVDMKFDAGICIEMIEHMTPTQVRALAQSLAKVSEPGSLFLFNTGSPYHAKVEDPTYLDPLVRGHIVSWGREALRRIFEPEGFTVFEVGGKSFAFAVEYQSADPTPLTDRIWTALPENMAMLHDEQMGSVLYMLALDTARAYRIP